MQHLMNKAGHSHPGKSRDTEGNVSRHAAFDEQSRALTSWQEQRHRGQCEQACSI